MKFTLYLCLFLAAAWLVSADEEKKPIAASAPGIWSTSIEAFAVNGGEPPAVKSMMTADTQMKVTRIEIFDEQGPRLNLSGITSPFLPCSPQPAVTLTDGVTTFTLALSSQFLPKSAATYTDSGSLNLTFPAGTRISLVIAPPQARQSAVCMAKQLNVLVHFTARPQ